MGVSVLAKTAGRDSFTQVVGGIYLTFAANTRLLEVDILTASYSAGTI